MSHPPMISVVMPVYNSERYLSESIQSVLDQSEGDYEFIIIDDASTDRSWEIIQEFRDRDPRIVPVQNPENRGISATRNRGVELARGQFVATQDSDDVSLPDRFGKQLAFMKQNPRCGAVGGTLEIISSNGETLGRREYPSEDRVLRQKIFFYCPIAQPASMIRREVFDRVGAYDRRYPPAEDLDFWFRLGTHYQFGNIPDTAIRYRFYPESATGTKLRLIEKLSLEIRLKNRKNSAFKFGLGEGLYQAFHWASLYLVPSPFKMWLFRKLRDESHG